MNNKIEKFLLVSMILLVICLFAMIIFANISTDKSHERNTEIDYIIENEIHYNGVKSDLVDEVQNYIDSIAPYSCLRSWELIDLCNKYKIDLIFVLAQGEIESHFGTQGVARKTNSVWNVGAYDTLSHKKISKNYKYKHPNESIEPYLKLLLEKYLVNKSEYDLLDNFVDINQKRYASYPNYEKSLKRKYYDIKESTSIDSLQDKLNYYSIRCNKTI